MQGIIGFCVGLLVGIGVASCVGVWLCRKVQDVGRQMIQRELGLDAREEGLEAREAAIAAREEAVKAKDEELTTFAAIVLAAGQEADEETAARLLEEHVRKLDPAERGAFC